MLREETIEVEFPQQSTADALNAYYHRRGIRSAEQLHSHLTSVAVATVNGTDDSAIDVPFRLTYKTLNELYHQYGKHIYVDRPKEFMGDQCSVAEFAINTRRITDGVYSVSIYETQRSLDTQREMTKEQILDAYLG